MCFFCEGEQKQLFGRDDALGNLINALLGSLLVGSDFSDSSCFPMISERISRKGEIPVGSMYVIFTIIYLHLP